MLFTLQIIRISFYKIEESYFTNYCRKTPLTQSELIIAIFEAQCFSIHLNFSYFYPLFSASIGSFSNTSCAPKTSLSYWQAISSTVGGVGLLQGFCSSVPSSITLMVSVWQQQIGVKQKFFFG